MTRYLLDTDVLADLVRRPRGRVARRIAEAGEAAVGTSVVVSAELRYGARRSGSERLRERVDTILSAVEIAAPGPPADRDYAELRDHLEREGRAIGANDMLIAAQARSHGLTLVTGNVARFGRVPGLAVENWLTP